MHEVEEKTEGVSVGPDPELLFWIKKIAIAGGSKVVPTVEELNAFAEANGLISIEDAYEAQFAAMMLVFTGHDKEGLIEKARKSFYRALNVMKKERKKASRRPRYKRLEEKRMIAEIPEFRNVFIYLEILEPARRTIELASFDDDDDEDDYADFEIIEE